MQNNNTLLQLASKRQTNLPGCSDKKPSNHRCSVTNIHTAQLQTITMMLHVLLFNHSHAKIKLMKTTLRCLLLFTLLSIVLPVYAEQVPIVILDSEACQIKGWHNLGGCFQNATGVRLINTNLYLKQTITYSDKRAPMVGSFALNNFHADHYAITSSSSEVFTGHHIKFVTSELALGSGTAGKPINGCKIFLSGEHAVIRMRLIKSGEELSCTTN